MRYAVTRNAGSVTKCEAERPQRPAAAPGGLGIFAEFSTQPEGAERWGSMVSTILQAGGIVTRY